jgi:hypothetical protein
MMDHCCCERFFDEFGPHLTPEDRVALDIPEGEDRHHVMDAIAARLVYGDG